MSSVVTKQAMALLGGLSIAALFIWYVQSQKKEEENKKKKKALTEPVVEVSPPPKKDNNTVTEEKKEQLAEAYIPSPIKDDTDCDRAMGCVGTAGDSAAVSGEETPLQKVHFQPKEAAGDYVAKPEEKTADDVAETESQHDASVSEGDYDIEEQVMCEKASELMLDISHNPVEHEQFSWSEEMERSYVEQQQLEQNKIDANERYAQSESPGVASENSEAYGNSYAQRRPQSPLKLTITPLNNNTPSTSSWVSPMARRHSSGSSSARSSSCAASTSSINNESVSSQDSGRATGGLASSLSPMDDGTENLPMYEFEIPNTLVGLVIGIKGKTIKELSVRTNVKMLIRQHHTPEKVNTHQICQVRGKREEINKCLHMLRSRFPPSRFPDLNLQPVLPPPLPHHIFDAMSAQPCWLTLPDLVPCEVIVSCATNPGHFFLQQPTHPSFSSLNHLDLYMLSLYSRGGQAIPELPKPCQTGLLCAAPVLNAWFRAVTHAYFEDTDEVLVRFVDYGGYTSIPRSELRQIRTDLMSLPFQSTECYLAHVQPVDGTWNWSAAAAELFRSKCLNKVINATLVGMHADDKVHMVEISFTDDEGKVQRLDRLLMDAGLAKASDPSKLVRSNPLSLKRPSLKPQTSVVA